MLDAPMVIFSLIEAPIPIVVCAPMETRPATATRIDIHKTLEDAFMAQTYICIDD